MAEGPASPANERAGTGGRHEPPQPRPGNGFSDWVMPVAGAATLAAGVFAVLASLGLVPGIDPKGGIPWAGVVFGGVFAATGGLLLVVSLPERIRSCMLLKVVGGVLAFLVLAGFFTGMAAVLTLAAIRPSAAGGGFELGGLPIPLPGWLRAALGRVLVVLLALVVDAIALTVWWHTGKYVVNKLRGRGEGSPPADSG